MDKITKRKYYNEGDSAETVVETIIGDNSDRIFELEKQLHEQYAINNNSNAGFVISLISTLLIAVTGYGYVLYQHIVGECDNKSLVSLSVLLACAVMTLLHCVCIQMGSGQRMEQFITFNIRTKYYKGKETEYNSIFPNDYVPFGKTFCVFVQGVYNLLSVFTLLAGICIVISYCCVCKIICCVIVLIEGVLIISCVVYKCYKYYKYTERENTEYYARLDFLRKIGYTKEKTNFGCKQIRCGIFIVVLVLCGMIAAVVLHKKTSLNEFTVKPKVVKVQPTSVADSVGMDYLIIVDEQLIK